MVVKQSIKRESFDSLSQFRLRMATLIYDRIFVFLIRDDDWQEKFFGSFTPSPGDRVLNLGPRCSLSALSFAHRHSGANFTAMDTNSKAVAKLQRRIVRKTLCNVTLIAAPDDKRLPFNAGSFDTVICMLGLHDRPPEGKIGLIKKIMRVLRRGGRLYVVDFDKPENPGEGGMLAFAQRIWGSAAVAPHVSGSWVGFLVKVGLAGVRRQSCHSIGIGRLSVVKARKR